MRRRQLRELAGVLLIDRSTIRLASSRKHPLLPKACRKQIGKIHERSRAIHRARGSAEARALGHLEHQCAGERNGDGKWHIAALLDPNCKFAHTEAEIAYMELFNHHTGVPQGLPAAPQAPAGVSKFRKPVYQLYPMINHLNVFRRSLRQAPDGGVERTNHLV